MRVQRSAASLQARDGEFGRQRQHRSAHPRKQAPLEAAEHQRGPRRRRRSVRAAPRSRPAIRCARARSAAKIRNRDGQRPAAPGPLKTPPLLQELAVLHSRRAHRLAGPAAQAERGLLGQRRVAGRQRAGIERPHQGDPAPWRGCLISGKRVRRARRQAEAAGDAAAEQRRVEDRAGVRHLVAGHQDPSFPGLRMPAGSKAVLIRRIRSICAFPRRFPGTAAWQPRLRARR